MNDKQYMALAIAAAESVRGTTSPNPPVGCVLVRDGEVLATGATSPVGGPHAEASALRSAGEAARGATAYVTLEPCDHTGRTGPCSRALIEAGVAEVHYAVADPNPKASGGAETLRSAGITVHGGLGETDVREGPLLAWLHAQQHGRPYVTWKYAASMDGRVAAADGSSRWISGPGSRAEVHQIRAKVDAVLVGIGTVLTDDPALTARDPSGVLYPDQPTRIVLGHRELPPHAKVNDDTAPTMVLATHDVGEVLESLHAKGFVDLLLEGGPTLAGAFAAAGVIDRVLGYVAPVLIGDGKAAMSGAGVSTIAEALRFEVASVCMSGADIRFIATPRR